MNKGLIMWCWWFELTKRMTKPYCGTFCAHSSPWHEVHRSLNICKTQPQLWQGARQRVEQSRYRTGLFVCGSYLRWSLWRCWMSLLCVPADGGLCGGFCSSWPGRVPICSRFVWQCFNRGCSLHAPRHGHRNSKHVFTAHRHRPAAVCLHNPAPQLIQSLRAHLHKQIALQTYRSVNVYFMISVVSHKPTVLHASPRGPFI